MEDRDIRLKSLLREFCEKAPYERTKRFLSCLPKSLEFVEIPNTPADPVVVREMRADFEWVVRREVYRYVARHYPGLLRRIGASPLSIEEMKEKGCSPRRGAEKKLLGSSLDHLVSLHLGGTNALENLCILPIHVNLHKNKLERFQLEQGNPPQIFTFMPRMINGQRAMVAIFK